MNHELTDVQAGFRKGRGNRDQIANIRWIIGKAREFQKNVYFCFIDYAKAFDCVDHNMSKRLLISCLQSPSAVILKPKKIKSVTVFIVYPIYLS